MNTNVATTDSDGLYELLIPIGPVELTAWDDKLNSASVSLQMNYREQQHVDLTFQSGTISGFVLSAAGGERLADVIVTFEKDDGAEADWGGFHYQLGSHYSVETEADGSYSLELPEGHWFTRAKGGKYQAGELTEIDLLSGEKKTGLNFSLEVGATVQGVLSFDRRGWRVSSLRVVLISADGHEIDQLAWAWLMVTDEEPQYRIDGVPPGVHRVELQRRRETDEGLVEDVLATATVSVEPGQVVICDFSSVPL